MKNDFLHRIFNKTLKAHQTSKGISAADRPLRRNKSGNKPGITGVDELFEGWNEH